MEETRSTLVEAYHESERFTLTEDKREGLPPRSDVITWIPAFDGIEMLSRPKSVLSLDKQRWSLNHRRELVQPEPVRRNAIISMDSAVTHAGLKATVAVKTRLVYKPEYTDVPKIAVVRNALDVETVIAKYHLAIEVTDPKGGDIVWVDAYSGEIVERASLLKEVMASHPGRLYSSVIIDETVMQDTGTFVRDPRRFSWVNPADGQPAAGQGVQDPARSYMSVHDALLQPAILDSAFALQESWDFFSFAFGRKGLRDIAPSTTDTANEAILRLDPSPDHTVMGMHVTTGVISAYTHDSEWLGAATLWGIGHEWTHVVFYSDTSTEQSSVGEMAGLDEASSNFLGLFVKSRGKAVIANQSTCEDTMCRNKVPPFVAVPDSDNDWIVGNEDASQFPPDLNLPANLCNPSWGYPRAGVSTPPPSTWVPGIGTMEGHRAASPINRMHCLLSRGIQSSTNPPADPNPILMTEFVPNGFAGLGSIEVAQLWYLALHIMHGSDPVTFAVARQAMLDATRIRTGIDFSDTYKAVEDAFAAILVGQPADRTPPVVTLPWDKTHSSATMPVDAFDLHAIDLIYSLDGDSDHGQVLGRSADGPYQVTFPSTTSRGSHTLYVRATDSRRNTVTYQFPITIENTAPTVTIDDESRSDAAYSTLRRFDFTATAAAGSGIDKVTIEVRSASTLVSPTPPTSQTPGQPGPAVYEYIGQTSVGEQDQWVLLEDVPEGNYVISATAIDVFGNKATASLPVFVREYIPPSICNLQTPTRIPADWTKVGLNASALDADSSFSALKFIVDGETQKMLTRFVLAPGQSVFADATVNVAAGVHTFQFQCIDQQGNSAVSSVYSMAFGPPPDCTLTSLAPDATDPLRIVMRATTQSSSFKIASVVYFVDNGATAIISDVPSNPLLSTYSSTKETGRLSGGSHQVYAKCTDSIGQVTQSNGLSTNLVSVVACTPSGSSGTSDYFLSNLTGGSQFVPLGRSSGHFTIEFSTIYSNAAFTIQCAGVGTINGLSTYSTGCYPFSSHNYMLDATLPFQCNDGVVKFTPQYIGCAGQPPFDQTFWGVSGFCATP